MGGFSAIFSRLEDPRTGNTHRHDFYEVLIIALCSCLFGWTRCRGPAATYARASPISPSRSRRRDGRGPEL